MDLGNTLLAATFAEQNPRSRSVSEDVATDRLAPVCASKESAGTRVTLDLVCQQHGDIELWVMLAEINDWE